MDELQSKIYSSRKHPNDMKYGKRPRRRGWFCSCGRQFCDNGSQNLIPTSGKIGSRKKTKGLGLKEENETKRHFGILINHEIISRNEEED
uniref:Uncharacterized protein n=1 Tax=viral metagenome TaxID=1070528 RepID=A0A6C0F5D9_9ZZZZ